MIKFVRFLVAVMVAIWALLPFGWAILTSLRSGAELFQSGLLPLHPSGTNYSEIFREQAFGLNLANSVIVAVCTVLLSATLALLAAFPLSRARFKGRRWILMAFLLVSMFPQIAILAGLFELIRALGLFNHKGALCLSYMILTLPFTVWTLTVFMRELPRSVEEAAHIDGAGPLLILLRIFIPMMMPSLVATFLLAFIAAWNEFFFALTFTITENARTVPVAIGMMSGASAHEIPWGRIMAASVLVTAPVVALVLIFQRRIVAGLTAGAVKG